MLFLASVAYEASAFKIIIQGGSGGNKFYEVIFSNNYLKCKGRGNNECPINFGTMQSSLTKQWYGMSEIVDFVGKQIEAGNTSGSENYNNDLPIRWNMQDDENVEIDIEECGIKGLEKYETAE